jgi:Concanavalin A-like lectin/glucanases superfamily
MRLLVAAMSAGAVLAVALPQPAAAVPVTVASYDFNGRSGALRDDTGRGHTMRLITARGGKVRPVVHGSGQALQFPPKCTGGRCPTAVLQTRHSADLNPGSRALAYGATVRLARSQTSKGQNVVQKGYSATSSQYKLQIDGRAGRPSCVLVDVRKRSIKQVRSTVSVADGKWHALQCRRIGPAFRILVDGVVRGLMKVPAGLSVVNRYPLSVGGKGTYADNDQFHGAVDDVYVRIG